MPGAGAGEDYALPVGRYRWGPAVPKVLTLIDGPTWEPLLESQPGKVASKTTDRSSVIIGVSSGLALKSTLYSAFTNWMDSLAGC